MTASVRFVSCSLAMLLGGLAAFPLSAQEFKVGFINTNRIFSDTDIAKAAQGKLEKDFTRREQELVKQGEALQAAVAKFEREAPTLSESQRAARQRQLTDQNRDFERKRVDFQEDLAARKNDELNQLLERANVIIKQVAEAEQYDVVLQEAVYIHPKHDITDKVIKAMNAGAVGKK